MSDHPDNSPQGSAGAVSPRADTLQALAALPPLSTVAINLQRLAQDDIDIRTMADAIAVDPALSADVLRLANSALFGARHTVPGVLHAIVMLGLERVKTLVITAAFMRFAGSQGGSVARKRCWRHSVACALIADELSQEAYVHRDAAYTAGILHDIGRLALLRLWPRPYGAILDAAVPCDPGLVTREREAFGMDHAEASDYLLRTWELPQPLTSAAKHHHDPLPSVVREPAEVVQYACLVADAIGFSAGGAQSDGAVEMPEKISAWIEGGVEKLQFRVATRMNALEVWL